MRKSKLFTGMVLASSFFLAACGSTTESATKEEPVKVTVGVVGEGNEPWDYTIDQLKENENIEVTLIKFTDYATPNTALASGEVDLNAFQTQIFLDNFNTDTDSDLTSIGYTVMAPLGIYSEKISDISEVKEGAEIAIPNDPSNGGRALRLLQTAGLLTLNEEAGLLPGLKDITDNPLNLIITELDSSQTARALQDVDASVINSGMAVDAGFIPSEDAVFLEPVTEESTPYYNVIAARSEDVENEIYLTIVEYFQSEGTADVIQEISKGSQIPVW
ncbi:MetQ/NlpA family ABC transporter substrate-binding protein [Jeotgalibaca sp. MA1X17-3]|uniref:MetQ/NlpA family ABC transporter substrate-binding protein n=1 Tax=Jeotgalibaca sp. MA1X17-3 TaxID=2908211 RepID=UPI001F2B89DB|nr:MetQ/NlpA family ABC transporter substrate-binding protein [Jeotgalibaca sp. MA1X17-3]UJF15903.1 MetQ/NlpA family ABC transporter substrate-binding protein [Jeotgalibaca sp. MA1X17-3]